MRCRVSAYPSGVCLHKESPPDACAGCARCICCYLHYPCNPGACRVQDSTVMSARGVPVSTVLTCTWPCLLYSTYPRPKVSLPAQQRFQPAIGHHFTMVSRRIKTRIGMPAPPVGIPIRTALLPHVLTLRRCGQAHPFIHKTSVVSPRRLNIQLSISSIATD